MENEHVTSADDSASKPASPEKPAKKPRSKIERTIVWGLIALLLGVTLMEGTSRRGYSKTLASLEKATEKPEARMTLAEFQDRIKHGLPIESRDESGAQHQITYTWPSLLHKFEMQIRLSEDDQNTLVGYSTADAPFAHISPPEDSYAVNEELDGALAIGEEGGQQPGGRGRRPRGLLGRLTDEAVQTELALTEDQKTQLAALGERIQTDFGSFRDLGDLTPEERTQRLEDRRKATEDGVREILNEQQFTRAMELDAQARETADGRPPRDESDSPRPERPSE